MLATVCRSMTLCSPQRSMKLRRFEVRVATISPYHTSSAAVRALYRSVGSSPLIRLCDQLCYLLGTDEASAEADVDRDGHTLDDPAHTGAAIAADGGATLQIEVHATAPPWLVDLEHDRKIREGMMAEMVADGTLYDHEEDSMMQRLLAMLAADSVLVSQISSRSYSQAMQRSFSQAIQAPEVRHAKHGPTVGSSWTKLDKESGRLVGNTQLVIRGAGPLDIVAYLMDVKSRISESRTDPRVQVRFEIKEVRNAHHIVTFYESNMAPFQNRTFLNASVWKKLSGTQYVWCSYPIASHPSITPSDERHTLRAETEQCMRLTCIAEGVTTVEYACSTDLKGSFPTWLTNSLIIPTLTALPYMLQEYFAQIRPIEDCGSHDGTLIGHMLMNAALKATRRHRAAAVATFILRTEMLRPASTLCPSR